VNLLLVSITAALVYSIGYWIVEPARCVIASHGCEVEGDITAVFFIVAMFVITSTVGFVILVGGLRFTLRKTSFGHISGPEIIFSLCLIYGFALPWVFFTTVGEQTSFWRFGGFWLNGLVGSICEATYIAFSKSALKAR
jgi:hypothetical protein